MKEYIVTLHKHEDLDGLYEDMETPGGNLYIPNRAVEVANRRPISRNTHYWLTAEEAVQLKNDPRVWDVSLTPEELGLVSVPGWTDTNGYYSKDVVTTANDKNWGLLRGFDRDHVSGWGSDGATKVRTSTLNSKLNGTNVDFVIRGYTVDSAAPEFAVNADGTGGSRYFYVNWGDYGLGSTYTQAALTNSREGAHETICGSIAFGNTQGWARNARFTSIPNNTTYYDYVRAWHQAKSVNPDTGFKNPTVVTDSYGSNYGIDATAITSITYRGTTYNGPFTTSTDFSQYKLWLNNTGETLYNQPNGRVVFSSTSAANFADIEDLVAAGVIFVGVSHNWRAYHAVENDQDWNNSITFGPNEFGSGTFYYNRGLYSSATGAIQAGAIMDLAGNTPSPRSGRGPRVNIWAPSRTTGYSFYAGETPDGTGLGYEGGVQTDPASQGYLPMIKNSRDPRNSNYYIVKTTDGTSFSAPQVAGVIGLWAELKPDLTPAQALTLLQTYGDSTGVDSTSANYGDPTSIAGATALALGFSPPTFAISVDKTKAKLGSTLTYTITTTNVPDGSTLYLKESGTATSSNFTDGVTQFTKTITNNTVTFTRTLTSNFTSNKISTLQVLTGGFDGTVQNTASSVTLYAYTISTTTSNANEGEKITYSVSTNGISSGTLYWAAISESNPVASPADITSPNPPLGTVSISSNSGTIEITLATDALTPEAGESFYINLYANQTDRDNFVSEIASSNTVTIINIPPSATYSFTSPGSGTAISEGGSTSFTVTTTNISNGTVLYWAAFSDTGAVANDISSPFPPQGTVTINSNTGTINITVATDAITPETGESFYLRLYSTEVSRNLYGTGVATSNAVSITDVPPSAPSPSYSFTSPASSTSASEGSVVNFTISTSNVANGTTLYWAAIATGTAGPSDAYPTGSPTSPPQGTVTISNNSGSISVTIATDLETPESNEGFYLNLYTSQANRDSFVSEVASSQTVTITNVAPGSTYSFSSPAAGTAVNEGDTVTFTVSTTNVANGTTLYWAAIGINGAGQADASNPSPPQGTVTISSNSGTISLTIARDDLTPEAGEGVKINLYTTQANRDNFVSEVASSNIVDIRNSTYSISPNSTSVVEGNTVTYTVTTTNVSNGTTLYWTNSGTTVAADFSDSSNSGSFTIQNNTGTITRTISVGDTLEGTETIILEVRIGSTSGTVVATASTVNVTDTLPTSITYSITPNKNTLAAGDTILYNITTTGVSDGTVLYLLENGSVSAGDFTDNYTQFIVTVLNNKASFSRTVSSSYVGTKTSVIRLLTGGYSGTLQVTAASVSVITLSISPTSLSNGVQGISYSATLSTAGGSDSYTYSVISGSLPAGITLSAGTGIISGTPTSSGTSNFTIRSTDTNNNTTSRTYSIQITQATLNVLPTSLSVGTLNSPYSRTFTITGGSGNYSYSISSGSLPSGISLSSSGVLSGTPDVEQISSFILYVTDNTYNIFATKNYTLKIQSYVITLLPDKLENGTVKTYYKQLLEADNGIAPYTYSLVSGSLPLGLSLNSSTGEISGMPARQASKTFNIGVTDSLGKTLVKNYTINISPFVIRNTFNVSSIVISQLPDYIRGDYVSYE